MIDWTQLKTAETLLVEARDKAWEAIKSERDRRKYAGVKVGIAWFHSDDPSRVQWMGLKDTARDMLVEGAEPADNVILLGQPVVWKTMTNTFVPVTVQLAFDVNQAVKETDAIAHAVAEQHRMAMQVSADPGNYDFSAGWPATFK